MRLHHRSTGRQRSGGQVLAEFTLVIPLFMLIVLAIAEGGYYVAATTMVNSATHEGARLGVLQTTAGRGAIRTRVVESASMLDIAKTSIKLQIARSNGDGTYQGLVNCNNTCYQARKKDDRLVVRTAYQHRPLVGYVFGDLTFPGNASAELTVEADAV